MSFFICKECGYGSASWMGRCPDCGQWNTLVERVEEKKHGRQKLEKAEFISFSKIKTQSSKKNPTGTGEFDRVLGGGLVPGETVLLTGEPGIGKSTLLLQSLANLKTAYISGEESAEQIKGRAERLGIKLDNFFFSDGLQVEGIISSLEDIEDKIDVLVIDSIQTVYSNSIDAPPGNISQLKESTSRLVNYAKKNHVAVILIGHVTKEGTVAGPKTLEHFVDCVLSFEGEKLSHFRVLRAAKNRFGSTDEIGIFEMGKKGLSQINNPMVFLDQGKEIVAGKTVAGVIEGKRSLFFEIQSLTSPSVLAYPRRIVKGVDYNKVLLLLAVIKKHLNLPVDRFDVYVNVVGGVNIKSTAADLAVIASIISSIKNISLSKKTVFIGEVGLLGEIRGVFSEERIIKDALRLRFQTIFSSANLNNIKDLKKIIES
jgi:DNA repair protein RadA/Sms